jgi:GMP synthase (glutamine-hydrolysing)
MTIQPSETILIVDFGSQVTQLIARRVREAGVYREIVPVQPRARGLSGSGPRASSFPEARLGDAGRQSARRSLAVRGGRPMLGICYGQQLMAEQLGGRVVAGDHSEFGRAFVDIKDDCRIVRRPVGRRARSTRCG